VQLVLDWTYSDLDLFECMSSEVDEIYGGCMTAYGGTF